MKRTSVFVWALGIVLAAAGPAAVSDDSRPLVVDGDMLDCPNADFTTIQAAVDAAVPGATIHVCAGEYHERVTIMKNNLRLRAKGAPGGAVVDADLMPGSLAAFLIQDASGVRIEGFTVRGGRESDILLIRATRATIRNNRTTAAGHDGIELMNSRDNVIERNVSFNNLARNACGINVAGAGSTGNVVRNNRTFNNEWGIQIVGSVDNVILDNEAIGNRGNGIRNIGNASGTLIQGNRAFSNGFAPSALTGTTNAGIRIGSGAGIVVSRNHAFGNSTVDLRSDVTTATFENNRCNTSAPPGLCAHDADGDDDDR